MSIHRIIYYILYFILYFMMILCEEDLKKGCHSKHQQQHKWICRLMWNILTDYYFCVLIMTNNIFSNGRIQQQTIVSQRLKNDKGKKGVFVHFILFIYIIYIYIYISKILIILLYHCQILINTYVFVEY